MADLRGKRKYAGPTVAERRKTDERSKLHMSPHKKPKVWTLEVVWTDTTTVRRMKNFTSRAARDEGKRRIERELAEKAAKLAKPRKYRHWFDRNSAFADFYDEQVSSFKEGPTYVEGYKDDDSALSDSEKS